MVTDLKIEMTVKELIAFAEKIEKAVLESQNKSKERKIPNTTPEQRAIHPFSY